MKKQKQKIASLITTFYLSALPLVSFAQIKNPLKVTSITGFISDVLNLIVKLGGIIAILAFIYSGFLFVKARGNESELKNAKSAFKNTVIGVALLLGQKF